MQCCSPRKPNLHCFVKEFLVLLAVLSYGKTFRQVISKSNSVYEYFVSCHIMKLLIVKRMRNVKKNNIHVWLNWFVMKKWTLFHSLSGRNFARWTAHELIRELLFQQFNSLHKMNRFFVKKKSFYHHIWWTISVKIIFIKAKAMWENVNKTFPLGYALQWCINLSAD